MSKMEFKNTFGAQASANGMDLQRSDLWKVDIILPSVLRMSWQNDVSFLLEKFPWPARDRDMIEVKYMQQTNFLIGRDAPTPAIEIPVRFAFGVRVAEALEKWFWLVSNPKTGGVGLTSQVKAKGSMRWLVPDMAQMAQDLRSNLSDVGSTSALGNGLIYVLEGCIIKGLKFSDADMTASGFVNLMFNLQIDRYYPQDINNMMVTPSLAS